MAQNNLKQLTLNQFKSWLEGVEEMQGDDWTPSPEQWKKIRLKISLVLDEADDLESIVRRVLAISGNLQSIPINNSPPVSRQFDAAPGPVAVPVGGSGLDADPLGVPNAAGAPRFQTTMEGQAPIPTKTPNIDTSHGGYTSTFV
jgi:hypothetical protein